MNNTRRKAIDRLYEQITAISDELEDLKFEEDEARDNMPENLQGGARYEQSEEASQAMEDAIEYLSSASDALESLIVS